MARHNPPSDLSRQRLQVTLFHFGFLAKLNLAEDITGVRAGTIKSILNRKTSARDTIAMLAKGLNVETSWLRGDTADNHPWWYPEDIAEAYDQINNENGTETPVEILQNDGTMGPVLRPEQIVVDEEVHQFTDVRPQWHLVDTLPAGETHARAEMPVETLPFATEPVDTLGLTGWTNRTAQETEQLTDEEQEVMNLFMRNKTEDGPNLPLDVSFAESMSEGFIVITVSSPASDHVTTRDVRRSNGINAIISTMIQYKRGTHLEGFAIPTATGLREIINNGMAFDPHAVAV